MASVLALVLISGVGHVTAETRKPNIVLLIADDQDYEHLGFMGSTVAHTPTLDRLARDGVTFTHGHVPMSRCRPALASLLTGRWPHQTGMYYNRRRGERYDIQHRNDRSLHERDSMPGLLQKAGYATYLAGKYWEGDARRMGFTHGIGATNSTFVREGQDELFAFIDERGGKEPLFIWWAPMLPHKPHDASEEYLALIDPAKIPVPPWIPKDKREAFVQRDHLGFATEAWFDAAVGELEAKLSEKGILDDTLFVFLIDNGWCNGCVAKGSAFEKGVRTPVVFSWPSGLDGGRRLDQLISTLDIYPTILELAGAEVPASKAGRSLRPALAGKAAQTRERLFGASYPAIAVAKAPEGDVYALYVRERRWKYILYLQDVTPARAAYFRIRYEGASFPARARGSEDLYDLRADPAEHHNLAAKPEHADRIARMRAAVLAWWHRTGGGPLPDLGPAPQ